MNFLRALPCLAASVFLGAQPAELLPSGGGELRIGATPYQFRLAKLSTAPPKAGLPGAVRLEGDLVPPGAARPFHLVLTVLKDGTLYLMRLERATPGGYPDTWAATVKTRTRLIKLEDRPGGRIEIRCEGPLTGIIAKRPQEAAWSGTLWAEIPRGDLEH